MSRRLLSLITAVALALGVIGPVAVPSALAAPSSATDSSTVPHYYGPYPNWANSPQALADAVVTFTPASPSPVTVGEPLIARAYATDYATAPGTLGPVFVVVPIALPAGTVTAFQTLNQAASGGSPTPSAGNVFHAYLLHPTGTPSQYAVLYDSGLLTVPALADPAVDETAAFPVPNVTVQAGDAIAFYGEGIPVDTGSGGDVMSYPAPNPPAVNDTITIGDTAFPVYPDARTYSFATVVTPRAVDPGKGAAATANVNPVTGGIDSVTITEPGSGYLVPPTVSIDAPGLTPTRATAHAVISPGVVSSVAVVENGFGFTTPSVSLVGGNPTAPAVLTASGGVDDVTLTDGGGGYTAPSVQFSLPDLASGVQATGSLTMSNGVITAVNVVNAGSGYTSAPSVTILDAGQPSATPALATATINILQIDVTDGGAGYSAAPDLTITDASGTGANATATAAVSVFGAVTDVVVDTPGSGYITPGIKKFVDTLPGVGASGANDLGQYIPIAQPDQTTYPDADYYEMAVVQYREQMHRDLPGTLLRGYVQLSTATIPGKHVPLYTANLDGTQSPILLPSGAQAYGVDNPHYMGPVIVATKDKPVRVLFRDLLPTGVAGDLFLPVDTTFMGAGMGPDGMMLNPDGTPMDMTMNKDSVMDAVRNPVCGTDPKPATCYTENRESVHLHGGITPWISDGSPHQWITPAGETTDYPKGVSTQNVPDMPDPGPGAQTFFYTNQQSARLLFYHDHAWGITRLNVYAGMAAPYLITDPTEQKLISDGTIPGPADTKELVIQDKTFVPNATAMALEDPTWDASKWGTEGNLWYEHVYMPAENPADPSGMSAYGRWFYGPYFWPPSNPTYGAIANPYYDATCNLDDPATWQYQVDPFCEPPTIPGTPNVSSGMEQYNDTPIVNGTAYPTTTVDPKTYRFRILNAANDRFWNLQWYVADPTTGTLSEVALKPAELAAAQTDPNVFPTPDTTKSPAGPSWVQIGTDSGFLPAPAVIPNQPISWITDQTRFDFGNVDKHALLLGPAERADVLVDFSQYRGKTLILYNDAPAAFPGRIPCYDYYTGDPDMTPSCAPSTLAGYGPNTRTIMQVKVSSAAPAAAFDRPNTTNDGFGRLQTAFAHHADGSGVFESGQNPITVGQAAYNSAYGTSFASSGWCNDPANPTSSCDGYARIQEQGGDLFKFDTLSGTQVSLPLQPKAIHDEMNAADFDEYGRMSGSLGLEAPGATPLLQNIILEPFVNPPTEIFDESNSPDGLNMTPISTSTDGTQIWKITHNGVDTHPVHFHLYDIQVINRVTWDNIIIPPDPNELGWKDTVRVSPLEDTIVAIRPIVPKVPFGVPDSIRPLNPMMPLGAHGSTTGNGYEAGFNNLDNNGNPITPIVNVMTDFGWEYMWHCHILSHEEMDMMRPQAVHVPYALAGAPVLSATSGPGQVALSWTDGTPVDYAKAATWGSPQGEVGYRVERAPVTDGVIGTYAKIADVPANQIAFTDATASGALAYRVSAWNQAGDSWSNVVAAGPTSLTISGFSSPTTAGTPGAFTVAAVDALGAPSTSYAGTVHFTSSDPNATLPADYTFTATDVGTAQFSATLTTAGTQSITVTDTASPSMNATQAGIVVDPGSATSLLVAGFPTPVAAGTPGSVTVTAFDAYGNTATGYTGTVAVTSTDPAAVLPGTYTFTSGDAGVHALNVTLKTVGPQSITVGDTATGSLTGAQSPIDVIAAAAATIQVGGFPSPVTAGTPGDVSLTVLDAYGNPVVGYTGTVHFSSSDGKAVLPADYTFTAADGGVHAFTSGVTLETAGVQSITATDTVTTSVTGSQTGITVNAAATAGLTVTGFPSPAAAGNPGTFTVTAVDAYGNVTAGYTGTVHFTSSDPKRQLPFDFAFSAADNGVHVFGAILETAGTQSITVTDTAAPSITGAQTGILVNAGVATSLSVSGFASPITAGTAGSVTVTAFDAYGNVAIGYAGTVHVTSSDTAAALPADYAFTAADNGTHALSVTLKTAGSQSITATDTAAAALTGSQSGIVVNPASATTLSVGGFGSPVTAGTPGSVTVTALDAYGNTASGYTGSVHFTSTDGQAVLPADYSFTGTDAGVHAFGMTLETVGNQSITATDLTVASLTGSQTGIVVNPGSVSVLSVSGMPSPITAGMTGTVTVRAVDAYGNTATGYVGTVHFTSTDASATLPADATFAAAQAGVRTFNVTFTKVGVWDLSVTDTANQSATGTQAGIVVNPAATVGFMVTGIPSPILAGTASTVAVMAVDAYGNPTPSYLGAVHFSSTDARALLPANYQFTPLDSGYRTFSVTLRTLGTESVQVTDTLVPAITGSESGIAVMAATTTTLASNRNPAVFGQAVTFTATVRPSAAGGTVQFVIDGSPYGTPVAVNGRGQASITISTLAVGPHSVSVNYLGSPTYMPSTSATLTETVNPAGSRTVLRTSNARAAAGSTVTFTATVTAVAPATGTPTGSVQFVIDGVNAGNPVTLNVGGQAAYSTSTLAVGSHTVSAVYSGDASFRSSTAAAITQRIR